jgi:hypothetical protein
LTKTATKPPAYLVERLTDLERASSLCFRDPDAARKILYHLSAQFKEHLDDAFVEPVEKAALVLWDSPHKAKALIATVIGKIKSTKREHEKEH